MIDSDLVNSNIVSLKNSIENRQDIGLDYAYGLSNIFTQPMIEKILKEFNSNTLWNSVEYQELSTRNAIPWKPESVIEEVHMVFESAEEELSKLVGQSLKFTSVNFWQDLPGYTIKSHRDNDRISVAIQVYINDADESSGTEFYKDNELFYKRPWKPNTGYVLNNVPTSIHGMGTPVNTKRQHIYVIYK